MGAPISAIQPLQKVQNFATRLILMAPRHYHSTPLRQTLHWLPISVCIKYKVACVCFHAINGSSPTYLSELLHIYTLSHTLRSSSDFRMLKIQQNKRKTHGFALSLTLDPMFGVQSHKTSGNAQLFHLLKQNWKLSFFDSTSIPANFSSHFFFFSLSLSLLCVSANVYLLVCTIYLLTR